MEINLIVLDNLNITIFSVGEMPFIVDLAIEIETDTKYSCIL